jgi:hypothetical protein
MTAVRRVGLFGGALVTGVLLLSWSGDQALRPARSADSDRPGPSAALSGLRRVGLTVTCFLPRALEVPGDAAIVAAPPSGPCGEIVADGAFPATHQITEC